MAQADADIALTTFLGALPVLQQVREEVRRRKIDLVVVPTAEAIGVLAQTTKDTNAILHLTC